MNTTKKRQKPQQKRYRLNRDQQVAFLGLGAIRKILGKEYLEPLEDLMDEAGVRNVIRTARWAVNKAFREIKAVIPEASRRSMDMNTDAIQIRIGVPMVGRDINRDTGIVVSHENLAALVEGCKDKCMFCSKTDKDVKNCALRRVFKELPVPDEPDYWPECGFKYLYAKD